MLHQSGKTIFLAFLKIFVWQTIFVWHSDKVKELLNITLALSVHKKTAVKQLIFFKTTTLSNICTKIHVWWNVQCYLSLQGHQHCCRYHHWCLQPLHRLLQVRSIIHLLPLLLRPAETTSKMSDTEDLYKTSILKKLALSSTWSFFVSASL